MFKLFKRKTIPTDKELDADLAELFRITPDAPTHTRLRAYGYIRKSRLSEIDPDHSLPGQARRIHNIAESRGWQLIDIFKDGGFSGRSTNRPGWRALKQEIKRGKVNLVIVDRLDRLSRNLIALLSFLKLCHEYGVTLISVREDVDFNKSWGRLVLYVLGALAQFYAEVVSEEIRLLHQHRAKQGQLSSTYRFGYCNGRCSECTDLNGPGYCPYVAGADRHAGAFRIPHPIESVAVRLAFEWYASGDYSDDNIARRLNTETCMLEDGSEVPFRTKGRSGVYVKDRDAAVADVLWQGEEADSDPASPPPLRYPPGPFDRDAVRAILNNPVYSGYVTYYSTHEGGQRNGQPLAGKKRKKPVEVYEGQHEALVPLTLYRRVQTLRRTKYHRTGGQQRTLRDYPLTGLLFCSGAHSPLRGISSNQGRSRYYVDKLCQQKLPEEQWHQNNLRADLLEAQVAELVTQLELPPTWKARILAYVIYEDGLDELEREKFALRERLQRARALYEMGEYDLRRFEQVRQQCQELLAALAPEAGHTGHETAALLDNLPALWATLTGDELKALYSHIFDAIYVNDAGITEVIPRRAFADLLGAL